MIVVFLISLLLLLGFIALRMVEIEQHMRDAIQIATEQGHQLERIANGMLEVEQSIEALRSEDDDDL